MKNSLLIALCLIAYFSVAAFGNWQRWKPDTVTGTTTVHDTLQGPTIEISTEDTVQWTLEWTLAAYIAWGDGEETEVFALANLTLPIAGLVSTYIRATFADGSFKFDDTSLANGKFLQEPDDNVLFIIYAFDTNGLFDKAEITIHFIAP